MAELKRDNPRVAQNSTWLHNQRSRTFSSWIKTEVAKRMNMGEVISDSVRWLAKGPYNGVKKI